MNTKVMILQKKYSSLSQRQKHCLNLGLIIAFFILLYAQSIHAPLFTLDDQQQIDYLRVTDNGWDLLSRDFYGFFRPVKNILFAFFLRLLPYGMATARLLALCIGLFSITAVYAFVYRLTSSLTRATLTTAVWALAPTLVSGTAWLSCVNIMLMAGLACWAFFLHLSWLGPDNEKRGGWIHVLLLFSFLGVCLLSYEGGISALPILVAIDVINRPHILKKRKSLLTYSVYAFLGLLYVGFRLSMRNMDLIASFSGTSRTQAMWASAWFTLQHLGAWIWPFGRFAVIGSYSQGSIPPWILASAWGGVLGLVLIVFSLRNKAPAVSLGLAWFLLGFAPMSNLAGFLNGPWGDYYITLASVGLALLFSDIVHRLLWIASIQKQRMAILLALVLLGTRVAAISEAFHWSALWNDPKRAWEETVSTFPNAFDPLLYLARIRISEGKFTEARHLAERAKGLAPDRDGPLAVLAIVALREEDFSLARYLTEAFLEDNPDNVWALGVKGFLSEEIDREKEDAAVFYKMALSKEPWHEDSLFAARRLAFLMASDGELNTAISLWIRIIKLRPDDKETHHNLAIAYKASGNMERALFHMQKSK